MNAVSTSGRSAANAGQRRGWCPTLFEPMQSGDGLLVRLRPSRGRLTSVSARQLAAASEAFGNGVLELTQRGAIQVRGLRVETVAPFAAAAIAAGLAETDPARERRRIVVRAPLSGIDPTASPFAEQVADAIEAALVGDGSLAALPPKFWVAVDAGGMSALGDIGADVRVDCNAEDYLIGLAGTTMFLRCAPSDAARHVVAVVRAFVALAGAQPSAPRRMRALLATVGADAVFAAAGLATDARPTTGSRGLALGWLPVGAFAVGLPFGATDAPTLRALAAWTERFGDGTLRLTPWRSLVLAGVPAANAEAAGMAAAALGLMVADGDPRAGVVACPGRPACSSATVDTRAVATRVAALGLPWLVHVSGCAKGCAHPAPAPVALVGEAGRYRVVRDGQTGALLDADEAVATLRGWATP